MGDDPSDPQADPGSSDSGHSATEDNETGYTDAGVPTFDSVREKIERRFETSIGAHELDLETPEGRSVRKQFEDRQRAAAEKLEDIRKSMREEQR